MEVAAAIAETPLFSSSIVMREEGGAFAAAEDEGALEEGGAIRSTRRRRGEYVYNDHIERLFIGHQLFPLPLLLLLSLLGSEARLGGDAVGESILGLLFCTMSLLALSPSPSFSDALSPLLLLLLEIATVAPLPSLLVVASKALATKKSRTVFSPA